MQSFTGKTTQILTRTIWLTLKRRLLATGRGLWLSLRVTSITIADTNHRTTYRRSLPEAAALSCTQLTAKRLRNLTEALNCNQVVTRLGKCRSALVGLILSFHGSIRSS